MKKHDNIFILQIIFFFFLVVFPMPAYSQSVVWSYQTEGYIRSSPAIGNDGTIYVGSSDDNLYAINQNGSLKWFFPTIGEIDQSSPVIANDGTIYIGSRDGNLYAINPNGTEKWSFYTADGVYIDDTPALSSDGTIYFSAENPNNLLFNRFYALNSDGTLKWFIDGGTGGGFRNPVVGYDDTVYIAEGNTQFYAINPNGSIKWTSSINGYIGYAEPPALAADGTIYLPLGHLYRIRPDGTTDTIDTAYVGGIFSVAVGPTGNIYACSSDGYIYVQSPDGELLQTFYKPFYYADTWGTPAIGADGILYAAYTDGVEGQLYAYNPNGTVAWNLSLDYDNASSSSPVIAPNGMLYIGSDSGKLYAIQTTSPGLADSSWPMFQANSLHTGRSESAPINPQLIGSGAYPQINDDGSLLWQQWDGHDYEIYFQAPGQGVTQITNNDSPDIKPQMNASGHLVWMNWDGDDYEIWYDLGNGPVQLTSNSGAYDVLPQIANDDQIYWQGWDGHDYEIYRYNPATQVTTQLTDNNVADVWPQVNASGQLAWMEWTGADWQIMYNLGSGPVMLNLPNTVGSNERPWITEDGQIFWQSQVPGSDSEIYRYDTGSQVLTQLTNNTTDDVSPAVKNGILVWSHWDGSYWQIYREVLSTGAVTPITNDGHDNQYPRVNFSGQIVWQKWDGSDYEIYTYQ
jgi:outer membrane protein assembly factor BamB